MSRPFIEVENLRVETAVHGADGRKHVVPLVDEVSFTLEKGDVLGLIGESGAGKSTVGLATLGYGRGACRVVSGRIHVDDIDVRRQTPAGLRSLRGRRVAYVAQSAATSFNPARRIGDQVIEATLSHGLAIRRDAVARSVSLFKLLGLPSPELFGERFPHQVSGGQLQRAMIAMGLCAEPSLVIFDEPTTALDVSTQLDVLAAIKRVLEETNTAALYISHDLALVAQIADHIMVLRHGKTVEHGSARQILESPREIYTGRLVSAGRVEKTPSSQTEFDPLLELTHINAGYGETQILWDVSLTLPIGQTLAICGESGSGKSTLARVALGLLPPGQGRVIYKGKTLAASHRRRAREELRTLQFIYQTPEVAMNPHQTVRQIIARPLSLYFGLQGRERERRVLQLLDQIELPRAVLDRHHTELSGGENQRICIARALAAKPEIIICDEPTSALDPLVAEGILNLFLRLQSETKVSYLFITHDIAIVRAIADHVAIMRNGRIVRFGPKETVLSPPFDEYTDLLLSSVPEKRMGWLQCALEKRLRSF